MTGARTARRAGGHDARQAIRELRGVEAFWPGLMSGNYKPLSERDMARIHQTALDLLEKLGMANPLPVLREKALARGCWINDRGRLCFPRALVEDVIAAAPRKFTVYGRDPKYDFEFAPGMVTFVPGGSAVTTLDLESRSYRSSTLHDLYDFARLADRLAHLQKFSRMVVPTEIADLYVADINTAYAAFAGTRKPFSFSPDKAGHIDGLLALMDLIAGGEEKRRRRPFCSFGGCPIVSPLTYGDDKSLICVEGVRSGAHVQTVMAPQAGATAPAALAGTLVQVTAESLAALLLVQLTTPGHPVSFGPWPFVSDLRTGSFTGGGGEQAVLAAAAAQIGGFYGLPTAVGAGMSDAKWPDAQMGYEKGMTVAMAALAGGQTAEVCGMMASLMGCSFEAMVIDNDMLGCLQRTLKGIEVTDETLSFEVIRDVVHGPGHFLGHPQTLALMQAEYLYPEVADRRSQGEWEEAGSPDILVAARARAREILSSHYPGYIDPATDAKIRERFEILLPRNAMRPGNGRW